VDVRKYAPAWCSTLVDQRGDSDEEDCEATEAAKNLGKALGVEVGKDKRHLTQTQWLASYGRYAVAAAVAGCYDYNALLKHQDNVLRLAEECRAKGKPTAVALVYDELARRECDKRVHSGLMGYDQNKALKKLDRDLAERAETALEAQRKGTEKAGGKGHDSHKGTGGKGQGKHDDRGEKRSLPWNREYWQDKDERSAKQWKR
jgi:hypothetical protein